MLLYFLYFFLKKTIKLQKIAVLNNYLFGGLFIPCEFIGILEKCASVKPLTSIFWGKKVSLSPLFYIWLQLLHFSLYFQ